MKCRFAPYFVALFLVCCSQLSAQQLSTADRDKAMQYLESTKKNLLAEVQGLSPNQWNFKAAPDRWSIAQCLEHIDATEDMIRNMIVDQVMKAPAAPDRDVAKIDANILARVPDRSQKRQAPEPLKPTDRFGSPEAALQHFIESRAKTEALLNDTPGLRDHATDSPMPGVKFDGYEWILMIAAHCERHTKQIMEVKADPNFPKS